MHKRIILCGPSCSGKNFIREKFKIRGYTHDVSYTSREPREGEINKIDYNFISKETFEAAIEADNFYEWVKYGDNYYGTGLDEWKECDIFIMETDGVKHINPEDRKNCVIIYITTPVGIRYERMKKRGWNESEISKRIQIDIEKFKDFNDYDLQISSVTL